MTALATITFTDLVADEQLVIIGYSPTIERANDLANGYTRVQNTEAWIIAVTDTPSPSGDKFAVVRKK